MQNRKVWVYFMEQGLIHVYHGEGKGKTTASVGLAIRAAGAGKKVVFTQFMKGNDTGELRILKQIPEIRILRNEKDLGFVFRMNEEQKKEIAVLHNQTLDRSIRLVEAGNVDVLIMDELTYPYHMGLVDKEKVEKLIREKPASLEIIITGRNPAPFFLEAADYITNMECERHPYEKGIGARRGIEY